MVSYTIKANKTLVGRNAVQLVQSFTPIKSAVYINKDGRRVNAKSILGLLSASIAEGDTVLFEIDAVNDNDASEVLLIIKKFFSDEE